VSYAETFRPPTINELLTGGSHPTSPVGDPTVFDPNPGLQPEVARTWEVGANFKGDDVFAAGDSIRLKADYFYSLVDNYVTANLDNFPDVYFFNNPGTSTVQGVEVQAAYDAGGYFGSLAYTHSHTDLPAQVNGFGASSYLPDDMLTATAGVRLLDQHRLTLGGRVTAVSATSHTETDTPKGYSLVDLFANYKFDNGIELGANVSNLFDTSYTPALSYTPSTTGIATGRGRTFELSLKANF
jgi:hemoglobin/transferrin/lactoferrin receptor protein